eukprot:TRINITY_DN11307_c0_g1_i1.p1 TRINITY_DN11307_c0_g1~~TRINITY_DN11307_c0_g1_i1.p1  ORF type:complete len:253 (-),score=60.58 TRINITY_DN11307_c0_g1_i1:126-884(-)
MSENTAVAFLAVARIQDRAVLATCFDKNVLNEEKKAFEATLNSVVERAGAAYPGWRERTDCQGCDGVMHAFADASALCVLVAGIRDSQYPDRVALQLLRDFADKVDELMTTSSSSSRRRSGHEVLNTSGDELLSEARPGALSTPLRKLMRDLMKSYGDPAANDKTTEVREKVDQLKGIMQDNVKRILETHVTLESLENSSNSMSSQANNFLRQSVDLRRQVQFRNLKIKLILATVVVAFILYLAVAVGIIDF